MEFILTTKETLSSLIQEAISKSSFTNQAPDVFEKKKLDSKKALEFLKDSGYKISYSWLMKLTTSGEIPHKIFGRSLLYDADELLTWAESKSLTRRNLEAESTDAIAKSARNKAQYSRK